LPGGEVGDDERIVEAAKRIAEEQTGLRVEVQRWLGSLGAEYLQARPIDGVPHADAIKLPLADACDRLSACDQAAIGAATTKLKASLHESQMPDDLKLALNVIGLPLFPEGKGEEKISMAQSATQILRGLNMSLNSRELSDGEAKLREQQEASSGAASDRRNRLRLGLLTAVCSLDQGEDCDSVLEKLRGHINGGADEVSIHNRQYIVHGRFTEFRPERKPPKPIRSTFD
jgi:hypothetical protein